MKGFLRQEAGFGCCVCGHPLYDYQHIVPYSSDRHFRAEDMMLLCPNHHREATLGAMVEAEQRRYKDRPHNKRHGFAQGLLKINQPVLAINLGFVFMVGDGTFLEVDGQPLLGLHLGDEGNIEVSVSLYDEQDNLLAEIHQNEWISGDPLPWDLEFGARWLTIRERYRKISLSIDARRFPISLRGSLWLKGQHFLISKNGLLMNGVVKDFGIKELCLVNMKICADTSAGHLTIEQSGRPGGGMLVSEAGRLDRVLGGIRAWQDLMYPQLLVRRRD